MVRWIAAAVAAAMTATPLVAGVAVEQQRLAAHEAFLAADTLHGRGSATADEAAAAAYVAAQFRADGLVPPPGMTGYLQTTAIEFPVLAAPARLSIDGRPIGSFKLIAAAGDVRGRLSVAAGPMPVAGVVVVTDPNAAVDAVWSEASTQHVALVIMAESDVTRRMLKARGNRPRLFAHLQGHDAPRTALATIAPAEIAALAKSAGAAVDLIIPTAVPMVRTTTNAVGYVAGTDPSAGLLMLSAHLDHLGIVDGVVMPGANDDASGVAAVLELARVLAAGDRPRRGILVVAYGSEEIGEFGSQYFALHPPVPLDRIAINIEFEMIGVPDPKLPAGALMMTGFARSNVGPALQREGASIVADPYPAEHFFERSDNYQLALAGVVAHTVSGWATTPTYHRPTDTIANLDLPFMTRTVQSLVAPVRWLANAPFDPAWQPGGRPTP